MASEILFSFLYCLLFSCNTKNCCCARNVAKTLSNVPIATQNLIFVPKTLDRRFQPHRKFKHDLSRNIRQTFSNTPIAQQVISFGQKKFEHYLLRNSRHTFSDVTIAKSDLFRPQTNSNMIFCATAYRRFQTFQLRNKK